MSIRILSGQLDTHDFASGTATILFRDHSVTGTLDHANAKQEIGPAGRFLDKPCKIVAMHQFHTNEIERPMYTDNEVDTFKINDTRIDQDCLEIEWSASGGSIIEEISYLVIGEV